ncbi:MAG TPA: response regulator [Methylomirabilota bacterium]|jgi:two-component system response regulator (stage 0 sporulation protein F)|nr:response regulator [Methylomirabilota bacterium]
MQGRLLLVDDEAPVLEVLSEYFVGQGYAVDTAASGEEALIAATKRRPDLVLLDVRMPGIDGVEVLRRLRRLDASLPIVMVTANEDVDLARETLAIGAFDYVAKPFDFTHLDGVVSAGLLHAGGPRDADDEPWSALARAVFQGVRGMTELARRSTGTPMEAAVLSAARAAAGGRSDAAREHLAELALLLKLAGDLGDLATAERDAIGVALDAARGAVSSA